MAEPQRVVIALRREDGFASVLVPQLERTDFSFGLEYQVGILGARRSGKTQSGRRLGRAELYRRPSLLGAQTQQYGFRVCVAVRRASGGKNVDARANATLVVDDFEGAPA